MSVISWILPINAGSKAKERRREERNARQVAYIYRGAVT
jgi:hypothetical protein